MRDGVEMGRSRKVAGGNLDRVSAHFQRHNGFPLISRAIVVWGQERRTRVMKPVEKRVNELCLSISAQAKVRSSP